MLDELAEAIARVRGRRYPTVLVAMGSLIPRDDDLEQLGLSCGLERVDLREVILNPDDQTKPGIVLGAYHRTQLRDWLRARARGTSGIIVTNADDLVSTWPDEDRRAFFMEFLRLETFPDPSGGPVVVLLSRHARRFDLPTDLAGQGALVNL